METQNWKQLASLQIGGVICLPVILIGQALSRSYGFSSAVCAILIGNLILLILACIAASMSFTEKKTTVQNAEVCFGRKGTLLFAVAMLMVMVGWFGIQLGLISLSVLDLLNIPQTPGICGIANLCLGMLLTFVGMFGLRALTMLSDLSLPILCATLVYALYSKGAVMVPLEGAISFGGISLVIAAAIGAVVDLPTYFRHAVSKKDAYIGAFLTFGLALPLMELVGVYLSLDTASDNVLGMLKKEGNLIWNIWVALFFILAGWTTNNTNLYSGAISLDSIFPRWSHQARIWAIGGVGTLLACLDVLHHLELCLDLLGILVISIGGVLLQRYFLKMLKWKCHGSSASKTFMAASCIGVCAGIFSLCGWIHITSIPVLDAFMGAFLVTTMGLFSQQRKKYETAHSG